MELLVFGHGGAGVLVFPTSMGRFYQYEDFGMVDALRHHLEQGWIQLFCVDSVDEESWYNTGIHPHDRAVRHNQYEAYILQEALPFVADRNHSGYLMLTGNSFGAYHAVNFTLKHPELVNRVIAISGAYSVPGPLWGYYDDAIYFNSPVAYLPNLQDERYLGPLRRQVDMRIVVGGPGDICHDGTMQFAGIMAAKGLPHTLDIWEPAWHDWPWWRQMILKHI
jgi:esterase/lipase superfamily enzyme